MHHVRAVRLAHQVAPTVATSAELPHRLPAAEAVAEGALLIGAALLEHRKLRKQVARRAHGIGH